MHNVVKPDVKIYVFSRVDNSVTKFKNIKEFLKNKRKFKNIGMSFNHLQTFYSEKYHIYYKDKPLNVVCDEFGNPIDVEKFEEKYKVKNNKCYYCGIVHRSNHRKDSIHHVHCYHRWYPFRHPRTYQESRMAESIIKEDMVKPARRNRKNLPNAWDDYYRHNIKNWKENRKTQWKEI